MKYTECYFLIPKWRDCGLWEHLIWSALKQQQKTKQNKNSLRGTVTKRPKYFSRKCSYKKKKNWIWSVSSSHHQAKSLFGYIASGWVQRNTKISWLNFQDSVFLQNKQTAEVGPEMWSEVEKGEYVCQKRFGISPYLFTFFFGVSYMLGQQHHM